LNYGITLLVNFTFAFMKKGILLLSFVISFVTGHTQDVRDDSLMILIRSDVHDTVKMSRTLEKLYSAPYNELHYYNDAYIDIAKKALFKPNVTKKLRYDYLLGLAAGYHNKGVFYGFDAKLDSSEYSLKKSIEIYTYLHNEVELPQVFVALGSIYVNQGNYSAAIELYYKALQLFEKNKSYEGMGYAQINIAQIYHLQDNYVAAIKFLTSAYENYEKGSAIMGMMDCIDKLFVAYIFLDKNNEAIEIVEKGINLIEKSPIDSMSVEQEMLYLYKARLHCRKKEFKTGIEYYKKTIALSEINGSLGFISSRKLDLARAYFDIKDYENAALVGQAALAIAKERHEKEVEYVVSGFLGEVYELTGDYKLAYALQKSFIEIRDSIQKDEVERLVIEKQFQYDYEKREILSAAANQKEISEIKLIAAQKNSRKNVLLISMCLVVCFLIIAAYFMYKFQRQKNTIAHQNANLLKQKLLISQMNPHFIFNALNAIQNFILKKDPLTASGYLANFSELVRMILDFSRKDFIDLQSELKFLKNYLDLQQLRANNNFEYRFEFDESVDPDLIAVPPMLSQPFIENAIEHGGFDAQNKGLIIIRFKINGDDLTCEIEDNGIGMENSLGAKNKKTSTHESLALKITEERIETLYQSNQKKGVQIIDKKYLSLAESGVLISFTIPLTEV
jgi:tetratricopeptide (TPR) repeat protein